MAKSKKKSKSSKTVGEKIAIWVGIVAGVVAIITAIINFQGSDSPRTPESAIFLGKVIDQNGNGIAAAAVYTLRTVHGDTIGFGQTDARGEFNFIVKSKPESSVYVLIQKDGKTLQHGFETLAGNKRLTFK